MNEIMNGEMNHSFFRLVLVLMSGIWERKFTPEWGGGEERGRCMNEALEYGVWSYMLGNESFRL